MVTITLPVSIDTLVIKQPGLIIYYPQVVGLKNQQAQQSINQAIYNQVYELIQQQYIQQHTQEFMEMIGTYELKTNERNILSLTLSNYAYAYQHAHGLTLMASLTFNIQTGKSYQLAELFKQDQPYLEVLTDNIHQQILERQMPVLEPFVSVKPNDSYYIADKALVIYYPLYELTPYYYGFPMFPISVYDIENLIDENGPLAPMVTNQ